MNRTNSRILLVPFIVLILGFLNQVQAQSVSINTTGNAPDPSAMLHVEATDKGLIVPRVQLNDSTTTAPVTSPAEGLLIYNETGSEPKGLYYWDSGLSSWVMVGDGAPDTYWDRDAGNGWLYPNTLSDNVGVGDASPEGKLDVHGRTYIGGNGNVMMDNAPELDLTIDDDETGSNTGLDVPGNDTLTFFAGGNEQARIFPGGVMAVNTNAVISGQTFYSIGAGNDNAVLGAVGGSGAGVQGENQGGNGAGVAGFATTTDGNALFGSNTNADGTALLVAGNNVGAAALPIGSGSSVSGSRFGVIGWGRNNADGVGVAGVGNQGNTINTTMSGSGVAGTGESFGVYGFSDSLPGGIGVFGVGNNLSTLTTPPDGAGVVGNGTRFGVWGNADDTSDAYGGYFQVDGGAFVRVGGYDGGGTAYKINGTGGVSTIVEDENGDEVNMFAPEAPEVLFTDYGQGRLEDGKARIKLDPTWSKNVVVDEDHPLRVFVQVEGECKGVYVTEKSKDGFTVVELGEGSSNVPFTYKVVANRANEKIEFEDGRVVKSKYEHLRFPDAPQPQQSKEVEQRRYKREDKEKKERMEGSGSGP